MQRKRKCKLTTFGQVSVGHESARLRTGRSLVRLLPLPQQKQ